MIAIQCPDHTHYHVQAENVLVEIIDARDAPCSAGQVGRIVVTDLHNFSSPLIRYEIGDFAEVGEPCPCGRGLPVLKRVMGRTRNMLTLPSGEQLWPNVPPDELVAIAPIRQYQLLQRSRETIEVRLVMPRRLTAAEEENMGTFLAKNLRYRFALRFVYVDEIPRSPSGKFEGFISALGERG
jgi:phenylacetate-CoA ligase